MGKKDIFEGSGQSKHFTPNTRAQVETFLGSIKGKKLTTESKEAATFQDLVRTATSGSGKSPGKRELAHMIQDVLNSDGFSCSVLDTKPALTDKIQARADKFDSHPAGNAARVFGAQKDDLGMMTNPMHKGPVKAWGGHDTDGLPLGLPALQPLYEAPVSLMLPTLGITQNDATLALEDSKPGNYVVFKDRGQDMMAVNCGQDLSISGAGKTSVRVFPIGNQHFGDIEIVTTSGEGIGLGNQLHPSSQTYVEIGAVASAYETAVGDRYQLQQPVVAGEIVDALKGQTNGAYVLIAEPDGQHVTAHVSQGVGQDPISHTFLMESQGNDPAYVTPRSVMTDGVFTKMQDHFSKQGASLTHSVSVEGAYSEPRDYTRAAVKEEELYGYSQLLPSKEAAAVSNLFTNGSTAEVNGVDAKRSEKLSDGNPVVVLKVTLDDGSVKSHSFRKLEGNKIQKFEGKGKDGQSIWTDVDNLEATIRSMKDLGSSHV